MYPDRLKLALKFDVAAMEADVHRITRTPQQWVDHFVQANYEGSWSVIPLRAGRGATHPVMMIYSDPSTKDYVNTEYLDRCTYLQSMLASFKTTLYAARLMRLGTGSEILEHRDHDLGIAGGCVRLHIPIITNPEVHFFLNQTRVIMREGECWYLRLSDPHAVRNNGPDRIHLVIDMAVNPWLLEQFTLALP